MKLATFDDVAYALGVMAKHQALIKKKEGAMNEKITALKRRFEEETSDANAELEQLKIQVEDFCNKNQSAFDKQRTMVFVTGKVGFRTNPPKITQLNRKFTVAASIELIKRVFRGSYIRIREEIDKDLILVDYRNKKLTDQKLAGVGLRVDQGETFFVEPDWEKLLK